MGSLVLPGGGLGSALMVNDGTGAYAPAPPTRLVERLKEIDIRLSVVWHAVMKQWSVMHEWHPNDRRWKLHRDGTIASPRDVVCFCPPGQDPDTIGDYIVEKVHKCDLSKHPGRRRLINRVREMQEHNRQVAEKNRLAAMEPFIAAVKDAKGYILRHPGKLAEKANVTVQYRR